MTDASRRAALSQFLKDRRARIAPADAGLPDRERRRTPGLRREDVAALSGVSLTWYTALEQGRDMGVSAEVLERVATTLRLSPLERDYLFELAQDRPAPAPRGVVGEPTPAMLRMLNALDVPAYIITMRWDVVAWNRMCARVLRDYAAIPPGERNLMRILLADEQYPGGPEEHHAMVQRLIGKLRVDYSQFPGDPGLERLVAELSSKHAVFRDLWKTPDLQARSQGVSVRRHPRFGDMRLEHTSYVPEGAPTLRVVVFAAYDAASEKVLRAIAAD
jgi:transcriptional regulator with XRE-family HTH domain